LIGLYSGRDIVARKANGEMLTRTQTAANAYTAITKKYGDISASAKYFHKGKGNWVRYSITNDRKRTGETTNDIKKWRAAPHKLDYEGKDTADTGSCGKSLSTAALTTSCEMVRGSGSRKKHKGKAADKKDAKRVDRDKLSVAERAPDVKASTGTKPATFDLKNNPNRKEFVSDYTGITDHLQRRAKRVAKIYTDRGKGRYKNADTRRREASHAKYVKRAEKTRTSYPKKRQ